MEKVASIDVGISNLGLVISEIKNNDISSITFCDHINLKNFMCTDPYCIYNTTVFSKTISHYMYHFFKEHEKYLDECSTILVEKQPPLGVSSVEQLIQYKYPSKVQFIYPNSVHSFYKMRNLSRTQKKEFSMNIAKKYTLRNRLYRRLHRKHDISDAIMFLTYWTSRNRNRSVCGRALKIL